MSAERNFMKNGVLVNLHFFAKALGIPKPEGVAEPVKFMEEYVAAHGLNWDSVLVNVSKHREAYKTKRRAVQKRKLAEENRETQEFFAQNNSAKPKKRKCLRCDDEFTSHNGNRMCHRCNYVINNFLGEDGVAL
jgi:ribosomal protein S27AE